MRIGFIHDPRNTQNIKSLVAAFILSIALLICHFNIPKYKIEGFTQELTYDRLVKKKLDHVWLRVSLYYYSEYDFEDNKASLVVNVQHNSFNHKYRAYDLKSNPHKKNEWNYFSIDYMTPYPYSKKDSIEFYVWYRDDKKLYVDDFKVEVFEKIVQLNR